MGSDMPIIDPEPEASESPWKKDEIYVKKEYYCEEEEGSNIIQQYTSVRDGTSIYMYSTILPMPGMGPTRINIHLNVGSIQEAFATFRETAKKAAEALHKEMSAKIVVPGNPNEILGGGQR